MLLFSSSASISEATLPLQKTALFALLCPSCFDRVGLGDVPIDSSGLETAWGCLGPVFGAAMMGRFLILRCICLFVCGSSSRDCCVRRRRIWCSKRSGCRVGRLDCRLVSWFFRGIFPCDGWCALGRLRRSRRAMTARGQFIATVLLQNTWLGVLRLWLTRSVFWFTSQLLAMEGWKNLKIRLPRCKDFLDYRDCSRNRKLLSQACPQIRVVNLQTTFRILLHELWVSYWHACFANDLAVEHHLSLWESASLKSSPTSLDFNPSNCKDPRAIASAVAQSIYPQKLS